MRKVCFSHKNLLLLCYVFLPLELPFYQVNTFFPLPGSSFPLPGKSQLLPFTRWIPFSTSWEITISTLYQINTFFHFWGTSYFHFWGTDMWPSHQPILNSLMRKVCFSQINLLLLCYVFLPFELTFYQVNTFFPLLGDLVSTFGQSQLLPYTRWIPFSTSKELHASSSWEITCDLVIKQFLSSLIRKICSSNINLQLLWYIFLPLEITFNQVNTFPTSGKIVSTSWAISKLPYTR